MLARSFGVWACWLDVRVLFRRNSSDQRPLLVHYSGLELSHNYDDS